ncbi:MAG TPA: hypothetical protein ENG33_11455 [Chloroflexi bacterium]|nr:hypothetical protein [Chloroflexota bacterium]
MNFRGREGNVVFHLLGLLALSFAVRVGVALLFDRPGYMDAYYYFDVAESIYHGKGMVEEFLWNYLDNPQGIPHPAFLYWMPLPSLLIYLSFLALGASYRASQAPFILLAALLPLLSYFVTRDVIRREHIHGYLQVTFPLLAALLTVFSGFYTVYWAAPDNFAPFALAGGMCLWGLGKMMQGENSLTWPFLVGVTAGLAHLARADGLLLLAPLVLLFINRAGRHLTLRWRGCVLALAAYAAVMAPWFIRNISVIGSPLPATGLKSVFLTDYDDLFSYGREISLQSYLAWGAGNIVRSKLWAAWLNFQTVLAVFLLVFLAPPFVVGAWKLRKCRFLWPFYLYAALLWGTMTLVFTFPGPRGSLFHSGGALLPFVFAVSAVGLGGISEWWAGKRSLNADALWRVNFAAAILMAMLVSGFVLYRAIGCNGWNRRDTLYEEVGAWLEANVPDEALMMVGNPPGFYYFTHRLCIVVPNGDVETVLEVANRYGASHLLLELNHPKPLAPLYEGQLQDARLRPVKRFGDAVLFAIEAKQKAFVWR